MAHTKAQYKREIYEYLLGEVWAQSGDEIADQIETTPQTESQLANFNQALEEVSAELHRKSNPPRRRSKS